MLVCVFFATFARETAGAARTRSSLRPLHSRGERISKTRAQVVARIPTFVMPAQAGIQYSETPTTESRTRGVLDTPPSRSMTVLGGASARWSGWRFAFCPGMTVSTLASGSERPCFGPCRGRLHHIRAPGRAPQNARLVTGQLQFGHESEIRLSVRPGRV
jgi:hypothetical protein